MVKKVILDTNFLLLPGQRMLDIFTGVQETMSEPYVLVVLDKSLNELKKIAAGRSRDAQAAKLGLALVSAKRAENPTFWQKVVGLAPDKQKALKVVRASGAGYVDDAILRFADGETLVATQDAALRRRLKAKGISTIVAQKKRIIVQQG